MAGGELEALKQGYETSLRQVRTLLEAQGRLREAAEQAARDTRSELERLAGVLCPGVVDELCKSDPQGLTQVPARALVDRVVHNVRRRLARLSMAEVAGQNLGALYEEAVAEVTHLRAENTHMAETLTSERRHKEQLGLRLSVLQRSAEDARLQASACCRETPESSAARYLTEPAERDRPVPSGDPLPPWVQDWQCQESHGRDLALLQVLAETGVPRRTQAAALLGQRTGVDVASGTVSRLFRRCGRLGLVESIEVDGSSNGGRTHLVCLTERGRDACRLLLGREALPSQTTELLARHGTPARVLLNLEAADLLRDAGYAIDLLPAPVALGNDRVYEPDLAVTLEGRAFFVEVECETRRAPAERDLRWCAYHDATGGDFCIVVPQKPTLEAIRSEILFWAGQRRMRLWMTSLCDARGKKGQAVWLFKREFVSASTH